MLYRMVFYMYRILYVLQLDGICILTVFILTVFFLFPLFLYFCYFPPNDVISKYPPTFVDILVKTTTYILSLSTNRTAQSSLSTNHD